jgi:hypothetical protein
MRKNYLSWEIFIAALVVFIAMATPNLRRIVWWLLPLGSGWDDVIGALALIVIFIFFWTKFSPLKNQRKNYKNEH